MSSIANRVIKNTGFLYAKMGITMFISLYTTRLILNSLGASDFGIFNIVGGAISMLGFLNATMASATQRFMSYYEGEGNKEKQKSIFNVSFVLHFIISIIIGTILFIAGFFFFNGILNIPEDRISAAKVVYSCLIISTIFTVMTVPYDATMNAHENMKYYAVVGIFESLLKLLVALVCVQTEFDKLIIYGSLMACIPLITLSIMRIYCHKKYEECIIAPKKYWDKKIMKEMTSFAGWHFLSTTSSIITNYGMGIILNHFFGSLLNAAQGIANQVNGQVLALSNNFTKAAAPIIGKSAGSKNFNLLQKASLESTRITTILYCFISIPVFIYAPYIFKIWLKDVPDFTILFSRYIIIINLIEFQFLSLSNAVRSIGIISNMSKWTSIINLLSIFIVYVIFFMNFEAYFLYIVLLITKVLLLFNVVFNAKVHCNISIRIFIKEILIPLNLLFFSVTIIMLYFSRIYPCISIESLIINIIVFVTITIITLSLILNKDEKIIIHNTIYKIWSK